MNKEKSCGGLKSDIGAEDSQKMGWKPDTKSAIIQKLIKIIEKFKKFWISFIEIYLDS